MRFIRLKLGLSQEKFAHNLGIKRGRLAPYESKSSGDPEFYRLLVEKYNIDLHKFLIDEMNDDNYSSFFTTRVEKGSAVVEEDAGAYFSKSLIIDLIQQMKQESDPEVRIQLADKAISLVAKLMEENNDLRKEVLDWFMSKQNKDQ